MTQRNMRLNLSAAVASVAVSLVLMVLTAWALSKTLSLAVAAVLIDSALDLLVAASGLAAIVYATRPPDEDHAFGHGSVEDLTALGQALFLTGSALVLALLSVQRLMTGSPVDLGDETAGLVAMVISLLLTGALILWQRYVALRTGNRVVAADIMNKLGDLLPSLGALVALWASARFGITRIDTVVALIAAAVMLWGAYRIFRGAWQALMDRGADPALVAEVGRILSTVPGIVGHHDMRSRMAGSRVFIDCHVELDGALSLTEAHAIAAVAKRKVLAAHPELDLLMHLDPVDPAAPRQASAAPEADKVAP